MKIKPIYSSMILLLVTGLWLSLVGKPYNDLIFALHKISLVINIWLLSAFLKKRGHLHLFLSPIGVLGVILLLGLAASGALMSLDQLNYVVLLRYHQIAPAIMLLSELYLLKKAQKIL